MKKSLLAGAACIAIGLPAAAFTVDHNTNASFNANTIIEQAQIAEEWDITTAGAPDGTFGLSIVADAGGTFAAGQNYFITVEVSGGTLRGTRLGSEVVEFGGAGGADVTGSSVQAGATSTSATYLVSISNLSTPGDRIDLELPITYGGCASDLEVTVTVALDSQNSAVFEQGTYTVGGASATTTTSGSPVATCFNVFNGEIVDDRTLTPVSGNPTDSFLLRDDFAEFSTINEAAAATPAPTPVVFDTATSARLAQIDMNIATATDGSPVVTPPAGDPDGFLTRLDVPNTGFLGVDVALLDTALDAVDFVSAVFNLAQSAANVASFEGSVVSSLATPFSTGANPAEIVDLDIVVVGGTNTVVSQDTSTSSGSVNFDDVAYNLISGEAVATGVADDLNYEASVCGVMDWFGGANAVTRQFVRATGFGADVQRVDVIATNIVYASGDTGPATVRAPLASSPSSTDVEFLITNAMTGAAIDGASGSANPHLRSDVLFAFVGGVQQSTGPAPSPAAGTILTTLDCDRLQASPATIDLSPFGNDAGVVSGAYGPEVRDGDD